MRTHSRRDMLAMAAGAAAATGLAAPALAQSWERMPGRARDVSVGWVVGTTPARGGYSIHRWDADVGAWERMPGAALRIGGVVHKPYVTNSQRRIYRWDAAAGAWERLPGRARDVGPDWVIGATETQGGYSIHRWNFDAERWDRMPGGAVRIGGVAGDIWVVNDRNRIYRWDRLADAWSQLPGRATDIDFAWAIGTAPAEGGRAVYCWRDGRWDRAPGGGVAIAAGTAEIDPMVWVVDDDNRIQRRPFLGHRTDPGSTLVRP